MKYIYETIRLLKEEGCDFTDEAHFGTLYKRYIDKFKKAKELISRSSDVSTLYPLEDPRELIYKLYQTLDESEKNQLLQEFNRKKVDFDVVREFDDLDRSENWKPANNLTQK